MPTIEVNNRKIEARNGEMVIEACERAGIRIPTLCHLKHLTPTGACRLCVVEVEGQRTLQAACDYPITTPITVCDQS